MVVGDDHHVDGTEPSERQRQRVQPLGPDEGERRTALAPHRVEQHPSPVDLGENAGMAHPGEPQPGDGRQCQIGVRDGTDRHDAFGGPEKPLVLAKINLCELQHRPGRPGPPALRILEGPIGEIRRTSNALHPLPDRVRAEAFRSQPAEPGTQRTGDGHGDLQMFVVALLCVATTGCAVNKGIARATLQGPGFWCLVFARSADTFEVSCRHVLPHESHQ